MHEVEVGRVARRMQLEIIKGHFNAMISSYCISEFNENHPTFEGAIFRKERERQAELKGKIDKFISEIENS